MFSQATLLLALAASASAHMRMKYPVPYGFDTLNSSPLAPSDFPCKQRTGVYDVTEMNSWNAGETKTISFLGSAVHGGGSCQFSITTDSKPTLQSQWKVIESVVGGCPSNATGNLAENPDGTQAATFPVTMPSDMPDGQYTFAWTWLNKIGNREFYMNCAPIQVGSGTGAASASSASAALSSLPDMFVANLPATECSTTEGQDFNYPSPGKSIIEGNGAALGDTLTGSGCTKQNAMGAGAGSIGSPSSGTPATPSSGTPVQSSAASQPQASQKPAASSAAAPASSKVPSNPGGVFAPGASSAPASGPTAVPSVPAAQPTTPTVAKPAPTTPASDNGTTPSNGECTPCTNDGAVVCIGTKQFGLCNRGCAVAQDLAAGMACTNGAVVAATKRHIFPRAHLHRRLSAARFL